MSLSNKILIILVLFISLYSCKDDNEDIIKNANGVIIYKPYIWKAIHNDGTLSLSAFGGFTPSIIYDKWILQGGEKGNKPYVWLVDINVGNNIYEMDFSKIAEYIHFPHVYNNYIVFNGLGGHIFCYDLISRTVKWKSNLMVEFLINITGLDSLCFLAGYRIEAINPYLIKSAWVGNINTGEIKEFYIPDLDPIDESNIPSVNGIGGVERIVPFYYNNDLLLIIYIYKLTANHDGEETYFGLYNYSKKIWIYNKVTLGNKSEVLIGISQVYDGRLYHTTSSEINCIELMTGKKIWRTSYNNFFSPFGHVIADGKIIALMDGYSKDLVCHDLYTGAQIWRVKAEGTSSTLEYLNGVVYFASMGDGHIHAVDANTGKYLWWIKRPDDSGLSNECAVVPGENGQKGRVIVSTFLNGYCYEAER